MEIKDKKSYSFSKNFIVFFILIILGIFLAILFYIFNLQKEYRKLLQDYNNEKISMKQEQENYIINQEQSKKNYTDLKVKNYEYYKQIEENTKKLDFLDSWVVIVPNNTRIYHKYGCEYLDLSDSILVFNPENAKGQGFVPCSHCIK